MKIFKEALNSLNELDSKRTVIVCKKVIKEDIDLNEDIEHWVKKNYKGIFGDIPEKEMNKRIVALAKIDPTFKYEEGENEKAILAKNQGAYMPWILKLIKKNVATYDDILNDAHEYKDQLTVYDDLKKRNRLPADKKDIMNPNAGINSLNDLIQFLGSLGGGTAEDGKKVSHSDFKQDIANIREGLHKICKLDDSDIPSNIQSPDDVVELIGENDKWEIWEAKNCFGTMLFDSWGNGAGWCVGGMLGNNSGREQLRQAQNYYPNYIGDGSYVCFQQKDKNASRPTNKYLITLGPKGHYPQNQRSSAGYQFNNASNQTQYVGTRTYGDDYQDAQMDALAEFLAANGLAEVFKNSKFSECACFVNIENKQRLENGEPYKYTGGKIRDYLKTAIEKISFEGDDGKEHIVNAKEHPEYLECENLTEMNNMEHLINGEPYVFTGEKIPQKFKALIKEVIIPDNYDVTVKWESENLVGLPYSAFNGCVNLKKVTIPAHVIVFPNGCFKVNGYNGDYTDIDVYVKKNPPHKIKCTSGDDLTWLKKHVKFFD